MRHKTLILLGGNQPDTQLLLAKATGLVRRKIGRVVKSSSMYKSTPWGFEASQDFYNQVLEIETYLAPHAQLNALLEIETTLGRQRKSHGIYESRGIDLDVLFIDNLIIETADLLVPHPRLHMRRFTLVPLCEHWESKLHPVLNKTLKALLIDCVDTGKVERCS